MKKKTLAATITLLGTCKIFAAMPLSEPLAIAPGGESEFFSELPVVLSVTRLQQNMKDVPGFVTVIDAETIRHSGARDLAELLRGVPGFQVAFNGYGAPVAGYHGMANDVPKGLQVLIDGRTQYSTLTEGGVAWNLIDVSLEDIDRIEVLRGSNSPAFGSNSFMGVVNIVTRHTAETKGMTVRFGQGNQGIKDRYFRVGFGEGVWNARMTAESTGDQGIPTLFDDRKTEKANFRVDADWTSGNSLRVQGGLLRQEQGLGYPPGAPAIDQITNARRMAGSESGFLQLHWRRQDAKQGDTDVRAYRLRQTVRDVRTIALPAPLPPLATVQNNSGTAVRTDIEAQHAIEAGEFRFVGGFGWRRDVAEDEFYFGAGKEVAQEIGRFFGQVEWRSGRWLTANLGATSEHDTFSGQSLAPRAALNFHMTPSQTVKAIAGKSRRLPTMYESRSDERLYETGGALVPVGTLLYVGRSSTGQLKPEEVTSKELGYLGDFREWGLSVDARWFREDVKDRIDYYQVAYPAGGAYCPVFERSSATPCGEYGDYFNVIGAEIRGWEAQVQWRPTRLTQVVLTHSQVDIDTRWTSDVRALGRIEQGTVDYLASSSPKRSSSLSLRQRFLDRFTLAAAYYDVGGFQWTQNGRTSAYHRFDWQLAYDFRMADARAELAWTVRNDGKDHAEWWSTNLSGDPARAELIGTRQFVTLRIDY